MNTTRRAGFVSNRVVSIAFFAIIASWLILPLCTHRSEPPDALAYVAAVRQARTNPERIYAPDASHWSDVTPEYRETWCAIVASPPPKTCHGAAFLSSPLALPWSWAFSISGRQMGITIFRILAGTCLSLSMLLLWMRLGRRETRNIQYALVGSAVLLTPLALKTVALGQTSPLLFLSVCIGIGNRKRLRNLSALSAWLGGVVFKTSPIILFPLLVWRRRTKLAGIAFGALVGSFALSLLFVPFHTWSQAIAMNANLTNASSTIPHNYSVASIFAHTSNASFARHAGQALCLVVAGGFCSVTMRNKNDNQIWALGNVAWLLISPLVWSHYLWVAFGAAALLVATSRRPARSAIVLPIVAALMGAPVTFGAENVFGGFFIPLPVSTAVWDLYRPLALVAVAGLIATIARMSEPSASNPVDNVRFE